VPALFNYGIMDEPIPPGDDSVTPSIEKRSSSIQTIDTTVRSAAVDNEELLAGVPKEFLSGNPNRPLLHIDEDGSHYEYSLKPLRYSVMFILVIELLERFSYYGLNHSQLAYLTGEYNPEWNANLTEIQASSFVSSSVAIAYTAPFVGGIVADGILGDYWNIIFGTGFLYIPGLILIALCSYPYVLGNTYNMSVLKAGMLALYPIGAGFIKSVVNIFGAKQYHPRLQSGLISSYYVNFYLAINIGSVLGGITIPILARKNTAVSYTIPAIALFLGLVIFILGSKRYVRAKPRKAALWTSLYILCSPLYCKSFDSHKKSNGGKTDDDFVTGIFHLLAVFPATMLIVPFMICYNQVSTVFVVQGEAMQTVGVFDASMMTNFDSISVIVSGLIVQRFFYPALERRGIRMKYSHKFALGTGFAALAVASSLIIDYRIHANINNGGGKINIFYQIFPYAFVGKCGIR